MESNRKNLYSPAPAFSWPSTHREQKRGPSRDNSPLDWLRASRHPRGYTRATAARENGSGPPAERLSANCSTANRLWENSESSSSGCSKDWCPPAARRGQFQLPSGGKADKLQTDIPFPAVEPGPRWARTAMRHSLDSPRLSSTPLPRL